MKIKNNIPFTKAQELRKKEKRESKKYDWELTDEELLARLKKLKRKSDIRKKGAIATGALTLVGAVPGVWPIAV
eukprot:Pgem_evm1s6115